MSISVLKLINRRGSRTMRFATQNVFRMSTKDEGSGSKGNLCSENTEYPKKDCGRDTGKETGKDCCKDAAKEAVPLKTECSAPPPPMPAPPFAHEQSPCPPMPQCPPTICPHVPDPNNPCNYCPPECIDPDAPNLIKLKKLQCKFQEDNGIPIYLKGGKFDVFLYQLTLVMTVVGCLGATYGTFCIGK